MLKVTELIDGLHLLNDAQRLELLGNARIVLLGVFADLSEGEVLEIGLIVGSFLEQTSKYPAFLLRKEDIVLADADPRELLERTSPDRLHKG